MQGGREAPHGLNAEKFRLAVCTQCRCDTLEIFLGIDAMTWACYRNRDTNGHSQRHCPQLFKLFQPLQPRCRCGYQAAQHTTAVTVNTMVLQSTLPGEHASVRIAGERNHGAAKIQSIAIVRCNNLDDVRIFEIGLALQW